ncbi:MAG: hypothetical protein ACP5O2_11280 [Bacteroidales bacterium]
MAVKEQLNQILRNFRSRNSGGGYSIVNHKIDRMASAQYTDHALKLCDPQSEEYYKLKQLLNRYA